MSLHPRGNLLAASLGSPCTLLAVSSKRQKRQNAKPLPEAVDGMVWQQSEFSGVWGYRCAILHGSNAKSKSDIKYCLWYFSSESCQLHLPSEICTGAGQSEQPYEHALREINVENSTGLPGSTGAACLPQHLLCHQISIVLGARPIECKFCLFLYEIPESLLCVDECRGGF